jgi:purine/pyrimidine-nucleoside phosphorylase
MFFLLVLFTFQSCLLAWRGFIPVSTGLTTAISHLCITLFDLALPFWLRPSGRPTMSDATTPSTITTAVPNVTLTTTANVYFDGQCVSHTFTLADGTTKKSAGVIMAGSNLTFHTGAAEIMECVAGSCEYQLDTGSEQEAGGWVKSSAGESFSIPANSKFGIRVVDGTGPYHYICHFA